MANEKKQPEAAEVKAPSLDAKLSDFTIGDLMQIINSSNEKVAKTIAEALVESRKPYIDPKQLENEEAARKADQELRKRMEANIKASQANCPHLQGSNELSAFQSQLTSIVQHRSDTGEVVGICTNCLRVFRSTDPDYQQWMHRKSGNKMSQAGQRIFMDPRAVQAATR